MSYRNRNKLARNRREQKAIRRSERLAARGAATSDGDGSDAILATHGENAEQVASQSLPDFTPSIEQLPSELICRIGEYLPVESRITLALVSRTMRFKSGGIGAGTTNIALDEARMEDEDEDGNSSLSTPRMLLLELLERDFPLLTRCDYCRTLHSPLALNDPLRQCGETRNCFEDEVSDLDSVQITLPLVRRAVMWDQQGLDADSLFAIARCNSVNKLGSSAPYRFASTICARVSRGCVIVKKELFIARKTHRSGDPTARDLAALDEILCEGSHSWVSFQDSYMFPARKYKTPGCLTRENAAGETLYPSFKGFRDDICPPRRALPPTLRCILTHKLPCRSLNGHKKGMFPGVVEGSKDCFVDYSAAAIPVADPRNPWDRVLVFTSWRDLGSGDSKDDAKWFGRSSDLWTTEFGYHYYKCRIRNGSRVGDAYEAFEGAAEGAPYVPTLPRYVAESLFAPDGREH
ncbi:hypothetical protein B0I37DRAFT_164929 [Chaetomium sp. MPI-CAGE-AT-0009]|nr:hypothetical protein B0I37DRAFT_164929 [Chaetomium sp. MPI-CAGE-AT-0009]